MHGQPMHSSSWLAVSEDAYDLAEPDDSVYLQVSEALAISSKTLQKIKQNLAWAFAYNFVAIPLAAGALLPAQGIALTPSIAGKSSGLYCMRA